MIEGLKPYAGATKQSTRTSEASIPWLTSLPKHWTVVRSKRLFAARAERARPEDEQLSATQAYGVIPQKEFERRVGRKVVRIAQHLEKRAHVEKDDFVISMRSFQGGLERAWAKGCIRSSYVVLKPSAETHVGYFAHLFKSLDYIRALQATSNFIRDGQDLNFANFSLVDLPLAPREEQAAMARVLNHASRKIDGFIRAKQKLIKLLEEQKQAIIHRAVTRGLDPNARLKPSGVGWLGDVPEHWEVVALRRVTKSRCDGPFGSGLKSSHYTDSGVRVVRLQNIGLGEFRASGAAFISEEYYASLGDHSVKGGDLLIAGLGDDRIPAGRSCVAPSEIEPAMVKADCFRFRLNQVQLDPQFAAYHLSATAFSATASLSTGATRQRINLQTMSGRLIAFPPIAEQEKILGQLVRELGPLKAASEKFAHEIDLIREYRTRVIADVVTGKLDVREAATSLPDEADEVDALDQSIEEAVSGDVDAGAANGADADISE
jgi:type I restriction enzyme S subunit